MVGHLIVNFLNSFTVLIRNTIMNFMALNFHITFLPTVIQNGQISSFMVTNSVSINFRNQINQNNMIFD